MSFIATINFRLAGIPCLIGVTEFHKVAPWKGSAASCPSSDDWYGYTTVEFEVLDCRGRPAPWLEKKLTKDTAADIKAAIHEYFKEESNDC